MLFAIAALHNLKVCQMDVKKTLKWRFRCRNLHRIIQRACGSRKEKESLEIGKIIV